MSAFLRRTAVPAMGVIIPLGWELRDGIPVLLKEIHPLAWSAWAIAILWGLAALVTLPSVQRRLHLTFPPFTQLSAWFAKTDFDISDVAFQWVTEWGLEVVISFHCKGWTVLRRLQCFIGNQRVDGRLSEREKKQLPIQIANELQATFFSDIPPFLSGQTYRVKLCAWIGQSGEKSKRRYSKSVSLNIGNWKGIL